MTCWRQWLGRRGETLAEKTLLGQGCVIIERNHASSLGEIDLIARDGDVLMFCEVRSRRLTDADSMAIVGESIDAAKQNRLWLLAESYLQRHPALSRCSCRFDVILVGRRDRDWQVDWIKDAFRPGW
ncbi:MAG: YraN family protein [Magnetococcales bacterium]|nr:YraN family protein [Magnetococcales bacterium]MBF0151721.1 YraN family protein [Magnetococcales bacterium]MBF0171902.1 YraN family protein [Magnetococcales bacterium]MBF0347202.1 YraN family protein [Magnetococcales bacterium]MBF0630476.1 YraN family protein [Magnetococcales bacterium]